MARSPVLPGRWLCVARRVNRASREAPSLLDQTMPQPLHHPRSPLPVSPTPVPLPVPFHTLGELNRHTDQPTLGGGMKSRFPFFVHNYFVLQVEQAAILVHFVFVTLCFFIAKRKNKTNKKREYDTMSAMLIIFFYICTVFVSVILWCKHVGLLKPFFFTGVTL